MNISKSNLHIYLIHRLCSKLLPLQALALKPHTAPFQMHYYSLIVSALPTLFSLNILLEFYHQFALGTDTNPYTQDWTN